MEQQEDVFNILVATDNHIGYMEKDPVRGGDSLEAFKEILTIGKDKEVDFVLLGGDLFHDNKPSRHSLHRTMELLRQFCMGPRPCSIEFRSDPSINFVSSFPCVNYEDPNYNIDIPVFAIHGNHDDPTGEHSLSAMDLLGVCNLINYFGKAQDVEDITISPLLMQKGSTKLALYGLGSIRDERLARMFRYNKVKFLRPKEDQGKWFNLLVLHQNRAQHSDNNHIPPSLLPSFFDLVIWGHEHECIPEVEFETSGSVGGVADDLGEQGFYVYQPGSSVATSLSEGEVAKKHVGLLSIKGTDFRVDLSPLKTVRPFMWDHVCLSQTGIDPLDLSRVQSYLQHKVEGLIDAAAVEYPESNKIPLVRLRVDYSGDYPVIPPNRFGQQFVKKVANPSTILHWMKKKRQTTLRGKSSNGRRLEGGEEEEGDDLDEADEQQRTSTIASLLEDQLKREELRILSDKSLVSAVNEYVDKSEKDAITDFVTTSLQETQDFLKKEEFQENDDLQNIIEEKRDIIMERQQQATEETRLSLSKTRSERLSQRLPEESDSDGMDITTSERPATKSRGRGRGRGRGRAKSTTSGTGRGTKRGGAQAKRPRQSRLDVTTPTVVTSTPLVHTPSSTARKTTTTKKQTPRIAYVDSDNEDFAALSAIPNDGESSDDPFAAPISKKKKS